MLIFFLPIALWRMFPPAALFALASSEVEIPLQTLAGRSNRVRSTNTRVLHAPSILLPSSSAHLTHKSVDILLPALSPNFVMLLHYVNRVPKDVGDFLERCACFEEGAGQSVPVPMRPSFFNPCFREHRLQKIGR